MSMFRVFSCNVGRSYLLCTVCSLGKTWLVFALLHFVLQYHICLCIPVSCNEKGHLLEVFLLEGFLGLHQFSSVARVWLFATPWITARQASLSITNSWSSLKLMYSCPLSQWCHPAISSSVVPFSSCPQSLPASGSFPMSQHFAWGGQSIGVSASVSVLSMNTQDGAPSEWTGWISLQSKGLHRTVQIQHFWLGPRHGLLWYWIICLGNKQIILSFLRLHLNTVFWTLLLSMRATLFLLKGFLPTVVDTGIHPFQSNLIGWFLKCLSSLLPSPV